MSNSTLSRRSFLRASPALAATMAAPTAALAFMPSENVDLLELGRQLEAAEAAFADADRAKRAARELCDSLAPDLPNELIVSARDEHIFCGQTEKDAEGYTIWRDAAGVQQTKIPCNQLRQRQIIPAEYLRLDIQDHGPRTKVGRLARRKLVIAEQYELDMRTARERSSIDAAIVAYQSTEGALISVASKIARAPAFTTDGLGIKARALMACTRTDRYMDTVAGAVFGGGLADNVVSVLGSRAA